MVMEYLEGRDLGDVIDQGPHLPPGEAVDYVLQACEAIAEAHAAGIIHRDLKPRNLFLATTVDGRPLIKVLDFGISKTEDSAEDMSLTRTTEIIGSPSYMSPEQLRASKEVDVRTDIWALGVILYELLSKKVPFQAITVTELVAVVLMEPTPEIRKERPDVPEGLVYAINRCLAKRREERFSSIAELVGAIAPFGSGAVAGMAERISRVAQGSARALPPSDTGSGPYAHLSASSGSGTGPMAPRTVGMNGSGSGPVVAYPPTHGSGPLPHGATPPPYYPPSGPSGMPMQPGDAPPAGSSARLAIGHGGTSVAWGETQVDAPQAPRRSRAPLIASAVGLFVLLSAAGTGAVLYSKRHPSSDPTAGTAPGDSIALPPGRKDLPPMTPVATVAVPGTALEPSTAISAEAPSSLPSGRVPTSEGRDKPPKLPASAAPALGGKPPKPGQPPSPGPKPDDLSNIGRR
jgi:serine/threonine-protein kinase